MKKIFNSLTKPWPLPEVSSFKKGDIYKMKVAKRSHVKKPYYVTINSVGEDYIETYIPGYHSLRIVKGTPMWDYHISRMTLIGSYEDYNKLLYNQSHLINEIKK